MMCQECNKNKATRKYKTNKVIKNGANSYRGYKIHYVCKECWLKIIRGVK